MCSSTTEQITRRRSSLFRLNDTTADCDVNIRDHLKSKIDEFLNYSEKKSLATDQEKLCSFAMDTLPEGAQEFLNSVSEVVECYSKTTDAFLKRHYILEFQKKQMESKTVV